MFFPVKVLPELGGQPTFPIQSRGPAKDAPFPSVLCLIRLCLRCLVVLCSSSVAAVAVHLESFPLLCRTFGGPAWQLPLGFPHSCLSEAQPLMSSARASKQSGRPVRSNNTIIRCGISEPFHTCLELSRIHHGYRQLQFGEEDPLS